MRVERALVKWVKNQKGPGVVFFLPTQEGKAVCFPSRDGIAPPEHVRASTRIRQPQEGDLEECVLVMPDEQRTFFAFPVDSTHMDDRLVIDENHGFYHVVVDGEAEVTVVPAYAAEVEAWRESGEIHIVVRETE